MDETLSAFFDYVWGIDAPPHVRAAFNYLPVKDEAGSWLKYTFAWPTQRKGTGEHILQSVATDKDVYFSPALFRTSRPIKEGVLGSWVLWVDLDGNAPDAPPEGVPLPSLRIQSSKPGHEHWYWKLRTYCDDLSVIEDRNRALAAVLDADSSGWDANQVLRPPGTINHKNGAEVTVKEWVRSRVYDLSDFSAVPSARQLVADSIDLATLPTIDQVREEAQWTLSLQELVDAEVDDVSDRSSAMARVAYTGAEFGWTNEQIASVLYYVDDRWGKYVGRPHRDKLIVNLVDRARAKVGDGERIDPDLSRLRKDDTIEVVEASDERPSIWGFQDFVEADFPINWLVEGLLPEAGMMLLTGFPGTGKTQLSTQLCAEVATGSPSFIGWPLADNEPRKVLLLSLEMGPAPLHHFMVTIGEHYPNKLKLNSNLRLAPLGTAVHLDTPPGQKWLESKLEAEQPALLVIDSLQLSISKEMTDEQAAKDLMHYLATVRRRFGCAVVMIHHNRKKSAEAKQKDITQLSDMYGSIFFAANADAVISLDKRDEETGELSVHTLKNRLGAERKTFSIYRDEHLHFSTEPGYITNAREGISLG